MGGNHRWQGARMNCRGGGKELGEGWAGRYRQKSAMKKAFGNKVLNFDIIFDILF